MANLPTRNNNPGDLKDPATGSFRSFADPQSGFDALKADLHGKITGNTHTGLNGKSTLSQFASVYAPASDRNDPVGYSQKLATKLGVTPDTPIGSLSNRLDDFASAIADNEGYQGNRVSGTSESAAPAQPMDIPSFAAKIKAKYPQYQNVDDNTLTQKILAKYPQYQSMLSGQTQTPAPSTSDTGYSSSSDLVGAPAGTPPPAPQDNKPGFFQSAIQSVASPLLKLEAGSSKVLGTGLSAGARLFGQNDVADKIDQGIDNADKNGIDYGYFGKVKPVGAGFDINKSVKDNIAPLADAVGTGVAVGSDIAGGESLLKGASGLVGGARAAQAAKAVAQNENLVPNIIENYTDAPASKFLSLSPKQQADSIQEALSVAKGGDKIILQDAYEAIKPQVLAEAGRGSFGTVHPLASRALGFGENALKSLGKIGLLAGGVGGGEWLKSKLLPPPRQ